MAQVLTIIKCLVNPAASDPWLNFIIFNFFAFQVFSGAEQVLVEYGQNLLNAARIILDNWQVVFHSNEPDKDLNEVHL